MITPVDVYGVATEAEYRRKQKRVLTWTRTGKPHDSGIVVTPEMVFLENDIVKVICPCGDYPVVHPDWRLGLCFFCGETYTNVPIPETD